MPPLIISFVPFARSSFVNLMLCGVITHKFANDLRGGLILPPARLQELLAQFALNPDTEPDIFHGKECSRWIHICVALSGMRWRFLCLLSQCGRFYRTTMRLKR